MRHITEPHASFFRWIWKKLRTQAWAKDRNVTRMHTEGTSREISFRYQVPRPDKAHSRPQFSCCTPTVCRVNNFSCPCVHRCFFTRFVHLLPLFYLSEGLLYPSFIQRTTVMLPNRRWPTSAGSLATLAGPVGSVSLTDLPSSLYSAGKPRFLVDAIRTDSSRYFIIVTAYRKNLLGIYRVCRINRFEISLAPMRRHRLDYVGQIWNHAPPTSL